MSDLAIKVENVSKAYTIWRDPAARLKHPFLDLAGELFPALRPRIDQKMQGLCTEFYALKDVSFEVKKGESVGIIGRNGSGKSTLLQIIAGTLQPTEGSVTVNGRVAALLELGSGFNPEFTGRENVYLNCSILGLTKEETDARFQSIADFADIGDFLEQPVKTYSSGMTMRLAFAVAINVDPEILIVDEALSVGDELFQRKCFSRIEAIRRGGSTILFVSHSGAQIIELCDRAVFLDAGEKLLIASPKKAVEFYQKLLYAPAEKRRIILAQIKSDNSGSFGVNDSLESSDIDASLTPVSKSHSKEIYDPNLIPTSSFDFESHGPLIDKPFILCNNNQKVNGLIRGRKYRCCYRVSFRKTAFGVRFGMSIKTTTGLLLAGAYSSPNLISAINIIKEGMTANVEYEFNCNLNPGIYFVNVGVFGLSEGNETVLHRRAEIIAFRVLPEKDNIETEIVSLAFNPSIILS